NGDAQIGIWFFQRPLVLGGSGGGGGSPFLDGITGGAAFHKNGDVLILSNFLNGGGSANIQVYKVVASPVDGGFVTKGNKILCPAGSVESAPGVGGVCLQLLVQGSKAANGVCN